MTKREIKGPGYIIYYDDELIELRDFPLGPNRLLVYLRRIPSPPVLLAVVDRREQHREQTQETQ